MWLAVTVAQRNTVSSKWASVPEYELHPHALVQNRSFYSVNEFVTFEGLSSREPHLVFHKTVLKAWTPQPTSSSHTQVPLPRRGSGSNFHSSETHPGEAGGSNSCIEGNDFPLELPSSRNVPPSGLRSPHYLLKPFPRRSKLVMGIRG